MSNPKNAGKSSDTSPSGSPPSGQLSSSPGTPSIASTIKRHTLDLRGFAFKGGKSNQQTTATTGLSMLDQIVNDDQNYHLQLIQEQDGNTSEGVNNLFFNVPPGRFKVQINNTTGTGLRLFSSLTLRADVSCQSSGGGGAVLANDEDQLYRSDNIEKGGLWSTLVSTPMDSQQSTIRVTLFCDPPDAKCNFKISIHQIYNVVHTKGFELGKGEENDYKFDLPMGQYHVLVQSLNQQPFHCSYQLTNSTAFSEKDIVDLKILSQPVVVIVEEDDENSHHGSSQLLEVKVSSTNNKAVKAKLLILQSIGAFELKRMLDSEQRVTINEYKSLIDDCYREQNVESLEGLETMLGDLLEKKGPRYQLINNYVQAMKKHLVEALDIEVQAKDIESKVLDGSVKATVCDQLLTQLKKLKQLSEKNKLDTKLLISLVEEEKTLSRCKEVDKRRNNYKTKIKEVLNECEVEQLESLLNEIENDEYLSSYFESDDELPPILKSLVEEPRAVLKKLKALKRTRKAVQKAITKKDKEELQKFKNTMDTTYDKYEKKAMESEYASIEETLKWIQKTETAEKKLRESILAKQTHRLGSDIKSFEPYLKGTEIFKDANSIFKQLLEHGDADVSKYSKQPVTPSTPSPTVVQKEKKVSTLETDELSKLLLEDEEITPRVAIPKENNEKTATSPSPSVSKKSADIDSILADDDYEEMSTDTTKATTPTSKPKKVIPNRKSITITKPKTTSRTLEGRSITSPKTTEDFLKKSPSDTKTSTPETTTDDDEDVVISDDEDTAGKPSKPISVLESLGSIYSDVITMEDIKNYDKKISTQDSRVGIDEKKPEKLKPTTMDAQPKAALEIKAPSEKPPSTSKIDQKKPLIGPNVIIMKPKKVKPAVPTTKEWEDELKKMESVLLQRFQSLASKPMHGSKMNEKELMLLLKKQNKISDHPLLNSLHNEILILISTNGGGNTNNGVITISKFDHHVEHDIVFSSYNSQGTSLSVQSAQHYDHFIKTLSSICLNRTKKKYFGMAERTFYDILHDCICDDPNAVISDPNLRYMNIHRIHLLLEYFNTQKYAQKFQHQYQQSRDITLMEFLLDIGELVDLLNYLCKYCQRYMRTIYEANSIMVDNTHRDEFISLLEQLNQASFNLGYTQKKNDIYNIKSYILGSVENIHHLEKVTRDVTNFCNSKKSLSIDDKVYMAKFARTQICPIIEKIFKQGIKFQSVLKGYYHIWNVVLEMYYYLQFQLPDHIKHKLSTEKEDNIDTSSLTNTQMYFFDFVRYTLTITKSVQNHELLFDNHIHFRAWVCLALNHHKLFNFIHIILKHPHVLKAYYNSEASILNESAQEVILSAINALCELEFEIRLDHPEMYNMLE